jgi:hypothetical protein
MPFVFASRLAGIPALLADSYGTGKAKNDRRKRTRWSRRISRHGQMGFVFERSSLVTFFGKTKKVTRPPGETGADEKSGKKYPAGEARTKRCPPNREADQKITSPRY